MELWIRTSDKLCLTKVHHLYVDGCNNIMQENDLILATYKTKERALEVLDEIQNILQPRIITHEPIIDYDDMLHSLSENVAIHCTQQIETELKQAGQVVYQMPEE